MNSMIYNPLEEYENKFRSLHSENTNSFFENLVQKSGIDIKKNQETVRLYEESKENTGKLKKKLSRLRVFRVLMCISLLLIPFVILKTTPKIKGLRMEIDATDKRTDELLSEAYEQMRPLNSLFTERDALDIIESTVPLISFDNCFSAKQESDMKINYDYCEVDEYEQSTIDVLAGNYNENPFLFENKIIHTLGTETYHGY